jgi:hypothetical protein
MTAEGWILVKSAEGTRGTPTRRPARPRNKWLPNGTESRPDVPHGD